MKLWCSSLSSLMLLMVVLEQHLVWCQQEVTTTSMSISSAQPALSWLLGRRGMDFGWGAETARALLALVRTGPEAGGWNPYSLEGQLSSKQLDIELLLLLLKHKESELPIGLLAQYSLTLTALCRDPKDFYGRDLLGSLTFPEESKNPFMFAFNTLSVCAGGGHVKRRNVRKLLEIGNNPEQEIHNVDVLAMVAMATACIARSSPKYRHLNQYLEQPLTNIVTQQKADGSFDSNLPSTALAIQALQIPDALHINETFTLPWQKQLALDWLRATQKMDGSFGDLFTTTEVLMALSQRGYATIQFSDCISSSADGTALPALLQAVRGSTQVKQHEMMSTTTAKNTLVSLEKNQLIHFTYILWIGHNRSEIHSIDLAVPGNTSFYEAMKMAAEADPNFEFSATIWPNGHYVHTIGGHREQAIGFHFWLLYRLPYKPNPAHIPPTTYVAPAGVDDMYPQEGDYYLFWFKDV